MRRFKMSKLKDFFILLCCMQSMVSGQPSNVITKFIDVQEGSLPGPIYKFEKSDPRSVKFILEGEKDGIIDIEPNGQLFTTQSLDWETRQSHILQVKTVDSAGSVIEGPFTIAIMVQDVNERPAFNQSKYYGEVREQSRPDLPFMKVFATDKDDPKTPNAQLVYKIKQQIPDPTGVMYFQINNVTGEISTTSTGTGKLKFGDKQYELVLEVSDLAESPFSDNARAYITIMENLWKEPKPITIQENSTRPHPYNITKVTWNDQNVVYELHQREKLQRFPFVIDQNGNIYVTEPLDREVRNQYIFYALARNNNGVSVAIPLKIEVHVEDINDNPPVCPAAQTVFEVQEKEIVGNVIGILQATDKDQHDSSNSVLGYKILEQWPNTFAGELFLINSYDGRIQLNMAGLNIQQDKQYRLKVEVSDEGQPSLSTMCWVVINVIDTNDHIPIFQSSDYGVITLPENAPLQTLVKEIQATDDDEPYTGSSFINYTIVLGDPDRRFIIYTNARTNRGYVRVAAWLDYETCREHDLVIEATNPEPLFTGIHYNSSSSTNLKVIVTNVDEKPIFDSPLFQAQVPENITVGTFLIKINASDPEGEPIRFSLREDTFNWLKINELTGEIYSNTKLDRERMSRYSVEVIATESKNPKMSSSVNFHLYLDDVNDNSPTLAKDYYNDFIFCYPLRQPESILFSGADADDSPRTLSLKFILAGNESTANDWSIQYVNGTTARLTMKHIHFPTKDIYVPIIIRDNGRPPLETNVFVPVRICSCTSNKRCEIIPVDSPNAPNIGLALGILFGTLAVIAIIIAAVFISINKKKKKTSLGVAINVGETVNLNL